MGARLPKIRRAGFHILCSTSGIIHSGRVAEKGLRIIRTNPDPREVARHVRAFAKEAGWITCLDDSLLPTIKTLVPEDGDVQVCAFGDLARRVMRDDAARFWMRSPNPDLGYEKPLDLIAAGQYQRVVDLLLALAEGVTI